MKGFWIGFPLEPAPYATGLHLTVVVKAEHVSQEEVEQAIRFMRDAIEPLLFFHITLKKEHVVMRGKENDVPTFDVSFESQHLWRQLAALYEELSGGTPFTMWTPHVSVDTPERLALANALHQRIAITEAVLKPLGEDRILYKVAYKF